MARPQLEQVLGSTRRFPFVARDGNRAVVTSFDPDDPIAVQVWAGDGRAALLTPPAAWVDVAQGLWQFTLTAAALSGSGVGPGIYRVQATCTPASDGQPRNLLDASIRFIAAAGSEQAAPVYASYEDLLDYCPRVAELQDAEADQAGFAEQRARARAWFDEELLRNYHPQPGRARRMMDLAGDDVGPYPVFAEPPSGASIPSDKELRAMLDADGLVVTDIIKECVSHKAAAIVYQGSTTGTYADEGARHDGLAKMHWYRAVAEVRSDPELDEPDLRIGRDVTFLT